MANLDLSATLELIDRISAPLQGIQSQADKVTKAFDKARDAVRNLEQSNGKINAFNQLNQQLSESTTKLAQAKQKLESIKQEIASVGVPTKTMAKELQTAQRVFDKLASTAEKQSTRLTQLKTSLSQAGIDTSDLASEQRRLSHEIEKATSSFEKQRTKMEKVKRIQTQWANQKDQLENIRNSSAMVAATGAAAITIPIKASIDFESSMADVKKVVDFGDNPTIAAKGLQDMSNEIIKLSKTYPMAAKDIAAIVAAGGQSGIARGELTAFATDAIKMGVAFDTTAQEAGQSMSELRTAFKMSQSDVVALADKINYLGNNTPAAAKSIMGIVQRIGPLGEVGGFASGSIAALGATMKGMGVQEEIAATGIKNMMLALVAGESATKSQKAAFKSLGLDHAKIAKQMQTDAEGTTLKVLQAVSKLDKYQQASTLKELFGSESLSAIAPLLTNLDGLQKNLQMVGDKTKYAGSMNAEYQARAATTANQLQLLKNNGMALAITLGNTLLPSITKLAGYLSAAASRMQAWANANPELAGWLMKTAAAVVIVAAGLTALASVMLTVLGPIALLRTSLVTLSGISAGGQIFSGLITAFNILRTAIMGLGIATTLNPIGIAIMAIALAGLLIYKYWAPIKAFFTGFWQGFIAGLAPARTALANLWMLLGQIFAPLRPVLDAVVAGIKWLASAFMSLFAPAQMTSIQLAGVTASGRSFGMVLGQIVGLIAQVVAGLVGALALGFQTIGTAIGTFVAMVQVHGGAVLAYIGSLPARFMAFLAGLPAQMSAMGGQIMDGLRNGIMAKAESVVAGIQSVASRVKGAFTGMMGIHSPSRVFMGYGDNIMAGLNNGLLANNAPLQSMIRTSDNLRNAMDTSAIQFDNRKPITASMANGGGFGGQSQAPININIYPQPNQSPADIAQLVAQELAKAKMGQQTNNTALYDLPQAWA